MTALIAYIPSLHSGYLRLFEAYRGADLFIISESFVKIQPRMDRDIRALKSSDVAVMVEALDIFHTVSVLDEKTLSQLHAQHDRIVMPDEELSRAFATDYLKDIPVEWINVFLRWDRKISTTESIVRPDRMISTDELDNQYVRMADIEAQKSPDWWRQVGALARKNDTVIDITHNTPLPSEYTLNALGDPRSNFDAGETQYKDLGKCIHAEAHLIARAARNGTSLDGASVYVTTFPCPACAKLLVQAGIQTVYYRDGYSLLDAEDILKAAGVEIILVRPTPHGS
jgi:dCMP deaminase